MLAGLLGVIIKLSKPTSAPKKWLIEKLLDFVETTPPNIKIINLYSTPSPLATDELAHLKRKRMDILVTKDSLQFRRPISCFSLRRYKHQGFK